MTTADEVSHPKSPPASRTVAGWLLISLLLHLFVAGEFWLVQQAALRWPAKIPSWIRNLVLDSSRPDPADPTAQQDLRTLPPEDPSLVFVEVDPLAATEDAPEKTPFYSTANALAAQVTPAKIPDLKPQIDGQQEKVIRTFENAIPKPTPPVTLPPAPKVEEIPETPPPQKPVVAKSEPAPIPPQVKPPPPAPAIGDLAVARPVLQPPPPTPPVQTTPLPTPAPTPPIQAAPLPTPGPPPPLLAALTSAPTPATVPAEPQPRKRPRRLSEVADRGMLAGQQMKQEGGARRLGLVSSLDVRSSPFGNYDSQMIYAIQKHWYYFLDQGRFAFDKAGKVVVTFKLGSDGGVREVVISESDVGEILAFYCSSAIIEPSPYMKWTPDMRRIVGSETRELTFTFYYN